MQTKSKTQRLIWMALMAALMAVTAQIVLPIGPVPFSMAVFGAYMIGAMLPPLQAAGSLAVYMLLGVVGLPVFAQFKAGPQVLVGPTGGYLLGYFFMALAVSLAVKAGAGLAWQLLAAVLGQAACYLAGTLWFMVVGGTSLGQALLLCVVPFILPDLGKAALALLLAAAVRKRLALSGAAGRAGE